MIKAPFLPSVIDALNIHQVNINIVKLSHPFTCPHRDDGIIYNEDIIDASKATHTSTGGDRGLLIATSDGWVCPFCGYKQDWAHDSMAQTESIPEMDAIISGIHAKQGLNTNNIILNRLDGVISDYVSLYMSRSLSTKHTEEENNKSSRIWETVAFMLASLRRHRMKLKGVDISPDKKLLSIQSDWIDIKKEMPKDGVEVLVLWQDQPYWNDGGVFKGQGGYIGGISNPGHDGYGCNAWISTRICNNGSFMSIGGSATHWKAVPESNSIKKESSSVESVLFRHLPLGARFTYIGGKDVWVVLEKHGCGLVAKWDGNILEYAGQMICSAAGTVEETNLLKVILI